MKSRTAESGLDENEIEIISRSPENSSLLWQLCSQHELISWDSEVKNNICWILQEKILFLKERCNFLLKYYELQKIPIAGVMKIFIKNFRPPLKKEKMLLSKGQGQKMTVPPNLSKVKRKEKT